MGGVAVMNSKAFVLGDPIGHSLSPLLHQTWLQETGQSGSYQAMHVKPDKLQTVLADMFADPSVMGANITLPHKTKIIGFADEVSLVAKTCNSANILYRKNGKIIADNTDIAGFVAPLLRDNGQTSQTALVFGAGGAARAVLLGLLQVGVQQIWLCNRTDSRAEQLCDEFNTPKIKPLAWAKRNQPDSSPQMIINASSAGMTGFAKLDIDLGFCTPKTLVYDLVYTPLATPLLLDAKQRALQTIGGLDMLIAQAKPCFKRFFGVVAPEKSQAKNRLIQALIERERLKT
ncbi:Shikimate 5-dehydrogenase I alpha [hydrothermal vent metagenome]|uniref:shikimate dehydrogenase (NADP(+)) n=1 Tax=hydrothermal vent metagenome TaxID=652676 RepID=A0A3B0RQZ4_9ZZZZ